MSESESEGGPMVWGEDGRPHPAPVEEEVEGMVWGEDGRPHPADEGNQPLP